jgi:putative membrane protein
MYIRSRYRLIHFLPWTRHKIYKMLLISIIPTLAFYFLGWTWLAIPWVPVALLGTATAFISGFNNTQTYNRMWEARQIYGAIINNSRALGIMVKDFIRTGEKGQEKLLHRQIFYRHFAWLTALRFQLRESKPWENVMSKSYNREYLQYYKVPEWESCLDEELKLYLTEEERQFILSKKNRAVQIIAVQTDQLRQLNEQGVISDYNYLAVQNQFKELYDQQGKCERIKNFLYPRQYATINIFFTNAFVMLLPFGFLNEFSKIGMNYIWFTIPFSVLTGWVFLVLQQIGESTENPFEGNANDVSITQMSRNIEIDMRDMLGEKDLPAPLAPVNDILM